MSAQDHLTVRNSLATPLTKTLLPTLHIKGHPALPLAKDLAATHATALLLNMDPNQPAPAFGLTDNNNTISKQDVENAITFAKKALKHKRKQKKGKHQITKRSTSSKDEAITQMKAKR